MKWRRNLNDCAKSVATRNMASVGNAPLVMNTRYIVLFMSVLDCSHEEHAGAFCLQVSVRMKWFGSKCWSVIWTLIRFCCSIATWFCFVRVSLSL